MCAIHADDEVPRLVCNSCQHNWCKACKVAWHEGMSCDEYQRTKGEEEADKGMTEYMAWNRVISCPKCGHGIEKISGCNRVMYVCFCM
jgi:hypothetical protein